MDDAAPIAGASLGERLYRAQNVVATAAGLPGTNAEPFWQLTPTVQALFDRAAVTFVASLTYTESEGTREALLSSVLLDALKLLVADVADYPAWARPCHAVDVAQAAIATAEARAHPDDIPHIREPLSRVVATITQPKEA